MTTRTRIRAAVLALAVILALTACDSEAVNRVRNALTRRGLVEHTGVRGVYAVTDLGRARLALRRGTAGASPAAS